MSRRPRRNHSPAFKAKVALAAITGEKTRGVKRVSHATFLSKSRHTSHCMAPRSEKLSIVEALQAIPSFLTV